MALVRMPLTPAAWSFSCCGWRVSGWKGRKRSILSRLDARITYIYDSGEGFHDVAFLQRCDGLGIIARNTISDIGEQFREISNLEYFIESEELQRGDAGALQTRWERAIGETASGFFFNHGELGGARIREAIWEGEFERSSGDAGCCNRES